jgi:type VI secretion system protein ImpK
MIATHNQAPIHQKPRLDSSTEIASFSAEIINHVPKNHVLLHQRNAGLNPLVDAASYLFSLLGKLKEWSSCPKLDALQQELIQEINTFQQNAQHQGYNGELIAICRYLLCATFDDILAHTAWGKEWARVSLLSAFHLDEQHQDKFFTIMERSLKDPALYIDLMELMYLCLSFGYKGQYRQTAHHHYQLEQMTNTLYKHIRAYRGPINKTLSPTKIKPKLAKAHTIKISISSWIIIFLMTACIIMMLFVSLGYLMDMMSNEPDQIIAAIQNTHPLSTIA